MRKFWSGSFRRRLFWAFLAAAMVPLLLCRCCRFSACG